MHKNTLPRLAVFLAAPCMAASAGVAVKWTAETSRVHPEIIEAWRGDTLDLSCTLKSYGQPVALGAATASFMWQTNGMGRTWWQTNATVAADGVIRATWSPAMDPGAGDVAFFMPVQSAGGASYRAAGRIRFRPSPGAGSQTIDLPQPGGTLDFGAYQLANAPWATLESVNLAIDANNAIIDAAITSATGAIVIPPPVDLAPYATTGMVADAVQASGNALAGQINAVSNAAMQRAEMGDYATRQDVSTAIAGIPIPNLAGYATEQYVGDYFAANYTPPDLSSYASRSYADAAASNAQATAIAAIPSLTGYATEQYVEDFFAANYAPPDLSSYASRSYADAAASNAQAAAIAAIPSLAGYATQSWTADYFATNYTPPDLSSYASRSYADAAASNAQATAIAAIPSLAGYATQNYAQNAAESAASTALSAAQSYARDLSWAASEGNTRLVSIDGTIWQDATGTVWQVFYVYGWGGTVINLSTSDTAPIAFQPTTGTPPAEYVSNLWWTAGGGTNIYIDVDVDTFFIESPATGSSTYNADGDPPLSATNITFTTPKYYYSLYYRPVALATNPVDRVLYESSGGGGGGGVPEGWEVVSNAAMRAAAATNDFLRLTGGTMRGALKFYDPVMDPGEDMYEDWLSFYSSGDGFRFSLGVNSINAAPLMKWYGEGHENRRAQFQDKSGTVAYLEDVTPAAPEITTALRWRADGTACIVTVESGGTLSADISGWTEGQAVMAIITLADGAVIEQGIELVGYGSWPTGTPFVACCYRIGLTVFVVPSVTL